MKSPEDDDIIKIKELLRHTGEFIAYFELAETKLIEWRHEIDSKISDLSKQSQQVHHELTILEELLSQAGTTRFRVIAEKALSQGDVHLQLLQNSCNQFTDHFEEQQEQLELLMTQCIAKIDHHCAKAGETLAKQLAQYDAHQFHRVANESCDHVKRVADDAVYKSNKLLKKWDIRFHVFNIFTTLATTFFIVLYLNGELPWEMHHKALNERFAGKALLQAWPKLSLEERTKILNDANLREGG